MLSLPVEVGITRNSSGEPRLEVAVTVHWHRDDLALARLAVYVMATGNRLQSPTFRLQQAAQFDACDRFQTAMSRIWMFDSGRAPCSRITASTPLIASRTLSFNSDNESACE